MFDVMTEEHFATIRLIRPEKHNRLNTASMVKIAETLKMLNTDPNVRVVIITGSGKAFCAGADIREFEEKTGLMEQRRQASAFRMLCLALHEMSKPVIAKVNGIAVGGGMAMVSLAHLAIASRDASFGTPEINVGAFPNMVMAAILRGLPRKRVLRMLMTGMMITAEEAESMGLVTSVCAPEELDEAVDIEARKLSAKSPVVMSLGLDSIRLSSDLPYPQALEYLQEVNTLIRNTEDFMEGSKAFMEKRQPVWQAK